MYFNFVEFERVLFLDVWFLMIFDFVYFDCYFILGMIGSFGDLFWWVVNLIVMFSIRIFVFEKCFDLDICIKCWVFVWYRCFVVFIFCRFKVKRFFVSSNSCLVGKDFLVLFLDCFGDFFVINVVDVMELVYGGVLVRRFEVVEV